MECLQAKNRRSQRRYERTTKGKATYRRYWEGSKGQRAKFYQRLRETAAEHASALEELE